MTDSGQVLKRRALRLIQSPGHPLYLFSLTGKELLEIGEISRVSRDEAGQLIGYRRPEVKRHIQNIVDYLNGENTLFRNSIILAPSSRVRFHQSRGPAVDDGLAAAGTLEIPLPNCRQNKPAWIVDGQQRAVALSKCNNPNDGICKVLVTYWTAVSRAFPEAWGKPPSASRLMHGAGIRAIGRIMDRVMPGIRLHQENAVDLAAAEIRRIAPLCRWTEGKWEDLGGVGWNEIQNVPRHIRLLSNVLIRAYLEAKGNA